MTKEELKQAWISLDKEEKMLNDIYLLKLAATRASAELRHAYKSKTDWELVARAIVILEKAVL